MKLEKEDYNDLIENYLERNLTEQENKRFQELLSTNAQLAEQYRIRITMGNYWANAKEYGETRQSIAEVIRKTKSDQNKKMFFWSIAASFLVLLSVSGIVMLSDQNFNQAPVVKNSNESEVPLVPQMKQAEEKASLHIMEQLELISPIRNKLCNRNDSIVFIWNLDVDIETNLTIINQKNGKTVYRETIKLNARKFILEKNFLPEGEYQWYIEGFPPKEKFSVISAEKQK